jgi:peptidoglycan hydrolase-like protein with peptidoglycan-binding domain
MANSIDRNSGILDTIDKYVDNFQHQFESIKENVSSAVEHIFDRPQNQDSATSFAQNRVFDNAKVLQAGLQTATAPQNTKFDYNQIQGVRNNPNVTPEFIRGVEDMASRLGAKTEHILSAMSFETGGTFSPSIQNGIKATGLIQFLPGTAEGLGTTVDQLQYVEKYFEPFKGKLGSLEAVYTSILSGSPKSPDATLFSQGTKAYDQNPLDFNKDGKITAREATTIVGARMFGGVRAVQQKLVDLGFVSQDKQAKFADGRWGTNTSNALGDFQKSRGLPQTGLMDEATGFALFGGAPSVSTPTDTPRTGGSGQTNKTDKGIGDIGSLQRGDRGESVKVLQDALVKLGEMSKSEVDTGYGIFGSKTEQSVKDFQRKMNLPVTGKFDSATQDSMHDIFNGVGRKNQNPSVTSAIQDALVSKGYMSRSEIGNARGTFGPKTESAIKQFQSDNNIQQTGKLGSMTYKALFNSNSTTTNPPTNNSGNYSTATNGRYYNVNSGILMSDSLKPKLENLAQRYFEITGQKLQVTSGYRPPARQAAAMYDKIRNEGETAVRNLYSNKGAVDEVLNAYRANRGNRDAAINAMTRVIQNQVDNGTYISRHLRSGAVDVSSSTNLSALQRALNQVGGSVLVEQDHYHVNL